MTDRQSFALCATMDAQSDCEYQTMALIVTAKTKDRHDALDGQGSELRAGQSSLEWLLEADLALFHARDAGRNQVAGATRTGGREILRPARVSPCHPAIAQV